MRAELPQSSIVAIDPSGAVCAGQDGGDEGNRTLNPRLAKAVLCQLSYVPGKRYGNGFLVASRHTSAVGRAARRRLARCTAPAAIARATIIFIVTSSDLDRRPSG